MLTDDYGSASSGYANGVTMVTHKAFPVVGVSLYPTSTHAAYVESTTVRGGDQDMSRKDATLVCMLKPLASTTQHQHDVLL